MASQPFSALSLNAAMPRSRPVPGRSWFPAWLRFCVAVLACVLAGSRTHAAAADAIRLSDGAQRVDAWPAVTVLFEGAAPLSIVDIPSLFDRFTTPTTSYATLGVNPAPVWLHIPLAVDAGSDGAWIFDLDYPPLDYLDVWLLHDGQVLQRASMGSRRPVAARPLRSRAHSLPLTLQAGQRYDLVLRAQSSGTLILPIALSKPPVFHAAALNEQMLQGLLSGLAICLLLYSLAQGIVLREPFFLKYCILITGSLLFSLLQFGIGMQYLWTDRFGIEHYAGSTSALIALVGSFLFIEQALDDPERTPLFSRVMKAGATFCAVVAVVNPLGLVPDTVITGLVSVLGPVPAMMGVPGAVRQARRGDQIGATLLLAWTVYFSTTAVLIGVIRGSAPANFWTLHAFQFGATFDMLAFTYVLGLRLRAMRQVAERAGVERDLMRSLAITDPLTGLANRRGFDTMLADTRAHSHAAGVMALYLIDVDGFKGVNDRFGHDAGDELLVQISNRLKGAVRASDIVARLGGDEFVVVADGLSSAGLAEELGLKLVALADEPFALSQCTAVVGLTIGYALAPPVDRDPMVLMQQADRAMYDGKRSGKHCLRRADPIAPAGTATHAPDPASVAVARSSIAD